ncbi:MAG: Hsp20/alpha crystallin family protein [Candidatus Diapherotrites archaeon]|nr:Hsp20/alpha crystallin family protein [Candidatus Diapherotrites archaeon]
MKKDLEMFDTFKRKKLFDRFPDFDNFFPELKRFNDSANSRDIRSPVLDVIDEGQNLKIVAELPGVEKKDIKFDISEGYISLSAKHKQEITGEGKNFFHQERSFNSFHRRFPLPTEVLPEKAKAEFKNGILEVVLPKKHFDKKEKKFNIQIG